MKGPYEYDENLTYYDAEGKPFVPKTHPLSPDEYALKHKKLVKILGIIGGVWAFVTLFMFIAMILCLVHAFKAYQPTDFWLILGDLIIMCVSLRQLYKIISMYRRNEARLKYRLDKFLHPEKYEEEPEEKVDPEILRVMKELEEKEKKFKGNFES